jgi:hypothetical protein
VGDWSYEWFGEYLSDRLESCAWIADLPERVVHRARAAYLGLVTQIDHQLKRMFERLQVQGERENTLIVFISYMTRYSEIIIYANNIYSSRSVIFILDSPHPGVDGRRAGGRPATVSRSPRPHANDA